MSTAPVRATLDAGRRHWFALALVVLLGVVCLQYTHKAREDRSAFQRWRPQLLDMEHGVNIWQRYNYPNPPIMAMLLEPLAQLPPLAGALCWFYLKAAMTLLAVFWVFRLIESPDQPFPPWTKAVAVLLSLRPIMSDLIHGNVNLFILFLIAAALFAFQRRRDLGGGVILGLAIACKLTPALFVPYFLWKRSWKMLAGCAAGLVLFLFVVPSMRLGWERNLQSLQSWAHVMVTPFVVEGIVTSDHQNQSLPGVLYRLTTHNPSFSTYVEDRYTPLEYHNFVSLPTEYAPWIVKGCAVLFALLVVWCCRTPARSRRDWRLALEFSIVVLGMLLFSERTWKHHCVVLLLPFSVLCYYLAVGRPGKGLRWYLIGSLVAVVLLMTSTSTGMSGQDHSRTSGLDRLAELAQVYGAFVWCYLILLAALVVVLRTKPTHCNGWASRVRDGFHDPTSAGTIR
jgi:alpha-1,2-mannosyltransferase